MEGRRGRLVGRSKLWWNEDFYDRWAALSSLRACWTIKTVVKRKCLRSPSDPLITSRTLKAAVKCKFFRSPSALSLLRARRKLETVVIWNFGGPRLAAHIATCRIHFWARPSSKTHVSRFRTARRCSDMRILIWLDEPSRRTSWVDRTELWRNAFFLKIFARAAVAKRPFQNFWMHAATHAVVAICTFSFCWMNHLAGFGGSITRNWSEACVLCSWNCSAHCTGNSTLPKSSPECHRYIVLCNSGSRWSA